MIVWLYGLTQEEVQQVSPVLSFLEITIIDPMVCDKTPAFIVVGGDASQLPINTPVPLIFLGELDGSLLGAKNVWSLPLPWVQKTLTPILHSISKASKYPAQYGVDLNLHVKRLESLLIRQALVIANGVVSQAAQSLQIQRTTLIEKMRRYNIDKLEP